MSAAAVSHKLALSIPRAELNRLCLLFGPHLTLTGLNDPWGEPLKGSQLLLAMAGRESSFGANLKPRHEPAYDINGFYWRKSPEVRQLVTMYGRDGACSYGPLQILAINAKGYTPYELGADPEIAMAAAVGHLNRYVLGFWRAATLEAICDCWNTGNARDANVPHTYIEEVTKHYLSEVIEVPE